MTTKKFYLSPEDIKPLVTDAGACLATDRITVDGAPVGFFYRDMPDDEADSGWRFTAGDENDDYMSVPENQGVFDVNTIANYDESIMPFLHAPVGAAYQRNEETGAFDAAESPVHPDDCLHPDYPIVEGDYALSEVWKTTLPAKFNRRVEEGALVLWRNGMTLYFVAWNNDNDEDMESRLALLKADLNPNAFDAQESITGDLPHFSYRMTEDGLNVLYGFVVSTAGHLQVAISFDNEVDLELARQIFADIRT